MHPQARPDDALGGIPSQRGQDTAAQVPAEPAAQASADAQARPAADASTCAPPRDHAAGTAGKAHTAEPPALPRLGTGRLVGGSLLVTAAVVAFDVWLTGRLSLFFDLCFVLVCLSAALLARRRGLFAVAVLGPLLLGGVVALLAVSAPDALTASDLPFVSTWLTGLAHHGAALAAAQAVALTVVGLRAAQTPEMSPRGAKVD